MKALQRQARDRSRLDRRDRRRLAMVIEGRDREAAGETDALPIGNVTLSGVIEENGGYRVETTTTSPISTTSEGRHVRLERNRRKGMEDPGRRCDRSARRAYRSTTGAELASAAFKMADKTVFSIAGVSAVITHPVDGKPMDFTADIASFSGDLSGVTDPQTKAIVDAFGYQTINGSYKAAGTWNLADGRMNVTQNDITVENAGKFGFKFDFGGYTLDFIQQMQEMQKKMAAQPAGETEFGCGNGDARPDAAIEPQRRDDPLRRRFPHREDYRLRRPAAGTEARGHRQPGEGRTSVRADADAVARSGRRDFAGHQRIISTIPRASKSRPRRRRRCRSP